MKVILRQDVEKLGQAGDVVKVAPGYGRNYLIPRKIAVEATPGNLKVVEIEYLYGCIPEPKRLVLFPGAGHGDLLASDPKGFAREVGKILLEFARCPKPAPPEKGQSAVEEPDLAPLSVDK